VHLVGFATEIYHDARPYTRRIVDPVKKLSGKKRKRTWFLEDNWYRFECWRMTNEKRVAIDFSLFPVNGAINGCNIAAQSR
jgi:hypothetical protein